MGQFINPPRKTHKNVSCTVQIEKCRNVKSKWTSSGGRTQRGRLLHFVLWFDFDRLLIFRQKPDQFCNLFPYVLIAFDLFEELFPFVFFPKQRLRFCRLLLSQTGNTWPWENNIPWPMDWYWRTWGRYLHYKWDASHRPGEEISYKYCLRHRTPTHETI